MPGFAPLTPRGQEIYRSFSVDDLTKQVKIYIFFRMYVIFKDIL
jgi:hypothetical protein